MARTKTYQHFCPVARSLEVIGEKWSLLIVRDLLRGPMRFTDLMRTLGNITPKWLTQRLRDLEAAGIVERDTEEGRREVYYRLTPKGRELAPVVGALNVWGTRHAMRPPDPEERLRSAQLATMFQGFLATLRVKLPEERLWQFEYSDGNTFDFAYRDGRWQMRPSDGGAAPDLRVRTSPGEWAGVLSERGPKREGALRELDIEGDPAAIDEFVATLAREMG